MDIINRTIKLEFNLEELAKDFGYNLEVDGYDDVFHDGYRAKDIKNLNLNMPEGYENVHKIFPEVIAMALESVERSAWAGYIRSERINALKNCLEKIDLTGGGAEYQSIEDVSVSAKAGIISVEIDEKNGIVLVEILNPEHLINTVINGVGYIYPDLSAVENSSESEIKNRFHNLNDYFEVYGESKPSDEVSNHYSPDIDEDFFKEEIIFRLEELSIEEVAEAVKEYIEETQDHKEAINLATEYTHFTPQGISFKILEGINEEKEEMEEGLSQFMIGKTPSLKKISVENLSDELKEKLMSFSDTVIEDGFLFLTEESDKFIQNNFSVDFYNKNVIVEII